VTQAANAFSGTGRKTASPRRENGVNDSTKRPDDETTIDELSPELALVDADLALIARSRMPDRPGSPVGWHRGPCLPSVNRGPEAIRWTE
jgi:hypothetical protein